MAEFAGTWRATQFVVTHKEHPAITFDVVEFGGTMTITVHAEGDFTGIAAIPGTLLGSPQMGTVPVPLAGFMHLLDEETVRIEFTPEMPPLFHTMTPSLIRVGNIVTLSDDQGYFDFDYDGVLEPRTFVATFTLR